MKKVIITFAIYLGFICNVGAQQKLEEIRLVNNDSKAEATYFISDDSLKQGEYIYKYEGKEQIRGNYDKGLKTGVWEYKPYYSVAIKGEYQNDKKSGRWQWYYKKKLVAEFNYRNDQRVGKNQSFYKSGKLQCEEEFDTSGRNYTKKVYYENGKLKHSSTFKNNKIDGFVEEFNDKGDLLLKIKFEDGVPMEVVKGDPELGYSGNLRGGNGTFITYNENATSKKIQKSEVLNFAEGKLHGPYMKYHYNGELNIEGEFSEGFQVGKWTYYCYMGTIDSVKNFAISDSIININIAKEVVEIFAVVEKSPEFPDGIEGLMKFLSKSVKYPTKAIKTKLEGTVYVAFVIDNLGQTIDLYVVRGVHPLLDEEALRVVRTFPLWTPGLQHGMPVNVKFMLPIKFKLM